MPPVNPLPPSRYPEYKGPTQITARLYNTSEVPAQLMLCLNATFFLMGNVSFINVPFPEESKNVDVFNAHLNLTECAEASTCGGFNILIISNTNKTICEKGISRDRFELKYGGKLSDHELYYPRWGMRKPQFWVGSVNITDKQWDDVYPQGDPCHYGPRPKKLPITHNPKVDSFCQRRRDYY